MTQTLEAPHHSPNLRVDDDPINMGVELSPIAASEVYTQATSTLDSYTAAANARVAKGAQRILAALKADADASKEVWLSPEFITTSGTDDPDRDTNRTPIEVIVRSYASGHYPMAAPEDPFWFIHDAEGHFNQLRLLSQNKSLSEKVAGFCGQLVAKLDASGSALDSTFNEQLRQNFEDFGEFMDHETGGSGETSELAYTEGNLDLFIANLQETGF